MGAGVLPTTIINGKLYFLFGKENQYEDSAPGFSDFGGGTDNNESFLETAVREGGEELTGFLGSDNDVKKMLKKHGTFNIDYTGDNNKYGTYRCHIFPMNYDPMLPFYYNNNQKFLQKRLDPKIIKKTKIFEKAEIRWVCIDDISKMIKQFRSYFQNIAKMILENRSQIEQFIKSGLRMNFLSGPKKNGKNKTLKNRKV